MTAKGKINITIDFDIPAQNNDAASIAILKSLLEWIKTENFARRISKGAEIPFEFNDK